MKNRMALRLLIIGVFTTSILCSITCQVSQSPNFSKGTLLGKTSKLKNWGKNSFAYGDNVKKYSRLKQKIKSINNFEGSGQYPKRNGSFPLFNNDPLSNKQKKHQSHLRTENLTINHDFDAIEGTSDASFAPPDCNGDIGLNYYVLSTNSFDGGIIRIYDKNTGELVADTRFAPLWAQINRIGLGDPIVFYDRFENRWVLTEFNTDNAVLIAISETEDPLGSYLVYEFLTPSVPDYPKYGNWTDAYYLTTQEPQSYSPVYAIDKKAMIEGNEEVGFIEFQNMDKLGIQGVKEIATPMDFSGKTPPPEGSFFCAFKPVDDDWVEGINDMIQYYEFKPDFEFPINSIINGPFDLITAPFELDMCIDGTLDCIYQIDNRPLATLPGVIMNKIQYRNFGDYESVVMNLTVDVTGDNEAGIRWIELRKSNGSSWEIYQEGTFTNLDGESRFLGAISQDARGNILLGYAKAGPNTYPSVGITARLKNDELGIMTMPETIIAEGTATSWTRKWGDYFSMTVDPVDDQTFWLASEYMRIISEFWTTRLTSFNIRTDSIDIGPIAMLNPMSDTILNEMTPIQFSIKNYSDQEISNVSWGLSFQGEELETGIITDMIPSQGVFTVDVTQSVDISAYGAYTFEMYTNISTDLNKANDTLTQIINKEPSRNFSAQPNNNNVGNTCYEFIDYHADFRNDGIDSISNFIATIYVNDVILESKEINQTVFPNETISILFTNLKLSEGDNLISHIATDLNGQADQIINNDKFETLIHYSIEDIEINIRFQSEGFANETTWEIQDENGVVITEGSDYQGAFALEDRTLCLKEGCYSFILYDSAGDGWDDSGASFLEIMQGDSIMLSELSNFGFGFEWASNFCVPFSCNIEAEVEFEEESVAGASDGYIIISFAQSNEDTRYSIDGGITFQTSSIFENIGSGIFDILVRDSNGCEYSESINLIVNTTDDLQNIYFNIYPNPHLGQFSFHLNYPIGPKIITIKMIDQNGKLIRSDRIKKFSNGYRKVYQIPHLQAGTYFLIVSNNEFHSIKKMVKN